MFDTTYNNAIIFEPPKKLTRSNYICSKRFMLDYILEMYEESIPFGILLISGNRTIFYKVEKSGSIIEKTKLYDTKIKLQKSQKKGGQSAQRIERLCEEKRDLYIKSIVEKVRPIFDSQVLGMLICGPAELKNRVRNHPEYKKYFDDITYGLIDTSEIDDNTILDVIQRNESVFDTVKNIEVISRINNIKEMMDVADNKLVFGYQEVCDNLNICLLESVVISDKLDSKQKKRIDKLNQYNCIILEASECMLSKIGGLPIVGIKFY